jgi:cytochrome c553
MKTTIVSTLEPNRCGRGFAETDLADFRPRQLVATVVALTIFVGSALSLGFGQAANDDAAATYRTNCASCHGADGHGSAVGKSLHAADFHSAQVQDQTDAQLATVISQGRGNMPPFGTSLSKGQIDALVKYIRTFKEAK